MKLVVALSLAVILGLSGCTTTSSPPISEPETIEKVVAVPMTGVHIEHFDFQQGDEIDGELVVEGQYDIDLSVSYTVETETAKVSNVSGSEVLSIMDIVEYEMFTFVAPVSWALD